MHYPAIGAPVSNTPVAQGVFPVCEFMHGSEAITRTLALNTAGDPLAGYIDTASRDRLRIDATSSTTTWESALR